MQTLPSTDNVGKGPKPPAVPAPSMHQRCRRPGSSSRDPALAFWWSMIFSENRSPPPELGCSRVLALLSGRKSETSDLRWSSPEGKLFRDRALGVLAYGDTGATPLPSAERPVAQMAPGACGE